MTPITTMTPTSFSEGLVAPLYIHTANYPAVACICLYELHPVYIHFTNVTICLNSPPDLQSACNNHVANHHQQM